MDPVNEVYYQTKCTKMMDRSGQPHWIKPSLIYRHCLLHSHTKNENFDQCHCKHIEVHITNLQTDNFHRSIKTDQHKKNNGIIQVRTPKFHKKTKKSFGCPQSPFESDLDGEYAAWLSLGAKHGRVHVVGLWTSQLGLGIGNRHVHPCTHGRQTIVRRSS